ncbi:hypothetical protein, partial [Megasphaera sp.]|uniref:hypothetical protein n=1 Tax=Megasphaera sp. TaxID=2023260 RepID=UPI003AF853DA
SIRAARNHLDVSVFDTASKPENAESLRFSSAEDLSAVAKIKEAPANADALFLCIFPSILNNTSSVLIL